MLIFSVTLFLHANLLQKINSLANAIIINAHAPTPQDVPLIAPHVILIFGR